MVRNRSTRRPVNVGYRPCVRHQPGLAGREWFVVTVRVRQMEFFNIAMICLAAGFIFGVLFIATTKGYFKGWTYKV